MNEVYGQFFDVDREELYQPEAALPNAPPSRPVRVRRPAAHGALEPVGAAPLPCLRAGRVGGGGLAVQEEPVPEGRPGRRARPALGRARSQARGRGDQRRIAAPQPLHPGRLLRQPGHGRPAQRRHARGVSARRPERAAAAELHRVAAGRQRHRAPDGGDPQLRQPHLGLAADARARPDLPGRSQPRVHGAADPGEPSRLVEGLQHRLSPRRPTTIRTARCGAGGSTTRRSSTRPTS